MEEQIAVQERIRFPVVGGMFYPEDQAETLACLRAFGLERGNGGLASAIIAPHGAWEISGSLAGDAFAAAGGRARTAKPLRVVLMGPIHHRQEEGLFLSDSHSFQTPLGDLPVDQELTEELGACSPLFEINDIPHLREHSIEVLLPFVKYCFPDAAIVPILMGQPRGEAVSVLAHALKTVFEPIMEDTLLVVSSNLAVHQNGDIALDMAEECLRLFDKRGMPELVDALLAGRINGCGGALVAGLLKSGLVDDLSPRRANRPLISVRGDDGSTVYYGALSFE